MTTLPVIDSNMIANNQIPFEPTHQGEVLREELKCRNMTQPKLAKDLVIKVLLLNELISGKLDFTIEYAMMIEAALGIDADFRINFQTAYNKGKARKDLSFMDKLAKIRKAEAIL